MKQLIKISLVSFFIFTCVYSQAQTDTIMNKEVEVIKAYQPTVSGAIKIGENPKIIDTANYAPTFDYRIFSSIIPVEKTINHLPFVKLGNPPSFRSNTGYAKIGAGNAWTPYAELFVNKVVSKKTDFGLQLMHFSSRPSIKLSNDLKVKSPYSDDLAHIFMKNYFKNAILSWDAQYARTGYRYYGFPGTDSTLYRANEDTVGIFPPKQALNMAEANFNLKNINSKAKLDYDLDLDYGFFFNSTGQKEHSAKYNGLFTYDGRKSAIITNSSIEYFYADSIKNDADSLKQSHQFVNISISPQYALDFKNLVIKAGINLGTIIGGDTSSVFHISPKIDFEYRPIEGILTIFAGVDGRLNPNNYSQSLYANPYINYRTILEPSEEAISFFGGFKGMISKKISYVFDVNYSLQQNEAFYFFAQKDSASISRLNNLYNVEYADVNVLRLGGKIRYSSNNITVGLSGNYYNHESKDLDTLTHQPEFDIALTSSVQFTKKIKGTIDATVIGPRFGKVVIEDYTNKLSTPTVKTQISTLKTIIDINIGAEYSFSKQFSFSAKATNLLNQNYERWHGYNQPGLLIMLGASYTF